MAAIGNADEEAYGQVYNIGNGVAILSMKWQQ